MYADADSADGDAGSGATGREGKPSATEVVLVAEPEERLASSTTARIENLGKNTSVGAGRKKVRRERVLDRCQRTVESADVTFVAGQTESCSHDGHLIRYASLSNSRTVSGLEIGMKSASDWRRTYQSRL